MTYATGTADDVATCAGERASRTAIGRVLRGALIFGIGASALVSLLHVRATVPFKVRTIVSSTVSSRTQAVVAVAPRPVSPNPRLERKVSAGLIDPAFASGSPPGPFGQHPPLGRDFVWARPESVAVVADQDIALPPSAPVSPLIESVPVPIPRPPDLRIADSQAPFRPSARATARQSRVAEGPAAPPDARGFFEKLFGTPQPPGPMLAYATPEDVGLGGARTPGFEATLPYDRSTAVYDISAHTVYMPDGTRLEAHSGLGNRLDDPRYVSERMRGPTPPHVYDLQPREQLFHGVRALRLNPVGNGSIFGRTGLLAHTYMLGPNGDSNGCVSFKNYNAFLQAYLNGAVKRLAVVARQI